MYNDLTLQGRLFWTDGAAQEKDPWPSKCVHKEGKQSMYQKKSVNSPVYFMIFACCKEQGFFIFTFQLFDSMDKRKVQQIHVILVISEMQVCGYNSLTVYQTNHI